MRQHFSCCTEWCTNCYKCIHTINRYCRVHEVKPVIAGMEDMPGEYDDMVNTNTGPEETIEVNYSQWLRTKEDFNNMQGICGLLVIYALVLTPISWHFRDAQVRLQKIVDTKQTIIKTKTKIDYQERVIYKDRVVEKVLKYNPANVIRINLLMDRLYNQQLSPERNDLLTKEIQTYPPEDVSYAKDNWQGRFK